MFSLMASARAFVTELLAKADVRIGGDRPQDIAVHDERLFNRLLRYGTLGLGEAYMDGWWDANELDVFMSTVLKADLEKEFKVNVAAVLTIVKAWLFNLQSSSRAYRVGEVHYDLGNDLYEAMLDTRMVYTCGYWTRSTRSGQEEAKNLDAAQEAKLDLICRKIGLKKGDHILDIGCGHHSIERAGCACSRTLQRIARRNTSAGLPQCGLLDCARGR